MTTAYPLVWPPGWPRSKVREKGAYRQTISGALQNLTDEIRLFGGTGITLSSNVTLGRDTPPDPGVVAYFTTSNKLQVAIPCDRWLSVAANIQAIALTIQSMRAIERHGAKHMVTAMFQGFVALPAAQHGQRDWREVLGRPATLADAEATYRRLIAKAHPDAGGTHEAAAELTAAIAVARKEMSA